MPDNLKPAASLCSLLAFYFDIFQTRLSPARQDSKQVVESYKSGFEPPGEVEFEDYGQAMKRAVSDNSLTNSREVKERPAPKSKGKLWPFIKNKNKVSATARLACSYMLHAAKSCCSRASWAMRCPPRNMHHAIISFLYIYVLNVA